MSYSVFLTVTPEDSLIQEDIPGSSFKLYAINGDSEITIMYAGANDVLHVWEKYAKQSFAVQIDGGTLGQYYFLYTLDNDFIILRED